jgi:hypothetical protein
VFNLSNASRTSLRASLEGLKDVALGELSLLVEDVLPALLEDDVLPASPFDFTKLQLVSNKTAKANSPAQHLFLSDITFSPLLLDSFQGTHGPLGGFHITLGMPPS